MITGKNFLVFSDDWGRHPFSCQHIMRHFLPQNRLLWVNTIGLRLPRPSLYDLGRALGKLGSWCRPSSPETLPEGLAVVSPFMIPFNPIRAIRAYNRRSVVRTVRAAMAAHDMHEPILLATVPNACDYVGAFGEKLVVYYCVDDFTVWPGMNLPRMVADMERDLLSKADLVLAVSDELCASRKTRNGQSRLLTHGVDVEHFRRAAAPRARPAALEGITGPIIGFYGLIDTHLDQAIVRAVLDRRPDWTVLLIGTKRVDLSSLESRPNFRWLPAVPYDDLPSYAACFDVAIIPYVVNRHTNTANPLKLREYLATEKPVVTTPMAEVFRFKDQVRIAAGPEAFAENVDQALHDAVQPQDRAACLAGESWRDKAEQASSWMVEALESPDREARA